MIQSIHFYDKDCNVKEYNPGKRDNKGTGHEIKANEELIGFYGVIGDYCFSSFGFILKVNPQ